MDIKLRLKSRHLFILILVLAFAYIGFGVFQAITHYSPGADVDQFLNTGFLIGLIGLYLYFRHVRKLEDEEKAAAKKGEAVPPEAQGTEDREPPAST